MEINCVLSSGKPLFAVKIHANTTVRTLKQSITSTLKTSMRTKEIIELLQPAPWIDPNSLPYGSQSPLQLARFEGQPYGDDTQVSSLPLTVCVLRPVELPIIGIDLEGRTQRVVYSLVEDLYWPIRALLDQEIRVLTVTSIGATLFHAYSQDTVHALKARIARYHQQPVHRVSLWLHDKHLKDEDLLSVCGVEDRERVVVGFEGDVMGYGVDSEMRRTVLPKGADLKCVQVLEPTWCPNAITAYTPFFPISPHPFHFHLISSPSSRLVTIHTPSNPPSQAVLPTSCLISHVKQCLHSQHGLPTSDYTIGFTVKLNMWNRANEYNFSDGDRVVITRKSKSGKWDIYVKVTGVGMKPVKFKRDSDTLVATLKSEIGKKIGKSMENMQLVSKNGIMDDEKPLREYCMDTSAFLKLAPVLISLSSQLKLLSYSFISPETPRNTTGKIHKNELFERFEPQKSEKERKSGFEKWVNEEKIDVKLVAPGQILMLRIHIKATAGVIKADLLRKLGEKTGKLLWNEIELDEKMTLRELGVPEDAVLYLVTSDSVRLSVQSPAGTTYLALVSGNQRLSSMEQTLPDIPNLPYRDRVYFYSRPVLEDEFVLPLAVGSLELRRN